MNRSNARAKQSRSRILRQLRSIHRWLGVVAAAFLLLLCVTGVVLNHDANLGLGTRFIQQGWLLDWYGIDGPDFGPSYAIDDHWITLASSRLYLDEDEVTAGPIQNLIGAVEVGDLIAVASADELLLLNTEGEMIERAPVDSTLPDAIEGIASIADSLLVLSGGRRFVYELNSGRLSLDLPDGVDVDWAEQQPLPEKLRRAIEYRFRGRGVSVERFVSDLHSGRLLGLSGLLMTDLAALALCVLAFSGVLIFFRR